MSIFTIIKSLLKKVFFNNNENLENKKFFKILNERDKKIIRSTIDYTGIELTGLVANLDSVQHVVDNRIPGSVIECGVWKGGSIKAMMLKFESLGEFDREYYLFDTFTGMTKPSEHDEKWNADSAQAIYDKKVKVDFTDWCYSPLDSVKKFVSSGMSDTLNTKYIQGDVLQTIPDSLQLIGDIAILRLDTDWYESTKLEMELLYPKVISGGVIIIDDYGAWKGARKAVDEYFKEMKIKPFLFRVDETRRIFVKD